MAILRIVVGLVAIIFVATLAFGQDTNFDDSFPLPEEALYDALEAATEDFQEEGAIPFPTTAESFDVKQLPKSGNMLSDTETAVSDVDLFVDEEDPLARIISDNVSELREDDDVAARVTEISDTLEPLEAALGIRRVEDQNRFGLLNSENGGFVPTVWNGVSMNDIDAFFTRVQNAQLTSPLFRNVIRRLILSQVDIPEGDAQPRWLAMRIAFLHHLGFIEDAHALLTGAGVAQDMLTELPGLPRAWVENSLLMGHISDACLFSRQHMLNEDHPFWRQVLLVCHVVQGNTEGLQLSLSLARPEDQKSDPLLYTLVRKHLDATVSMPLLAPHQTLTPLQALILSHTPDFLAPNVLLQMPDVLLRDIANNETFKHDVRVQAAEILLNDYGQAKDIALLSMLYDQLPFSYEVIGSPGVMSHAENEIDGSKARAMLWQAAHRAEQSSSKAMMLKALWGRAQQDALPQIGGFLTPNLRDIDARANLAWFAPTVVRYALRAGDVSRAKRWWNVMVGNRSLSRNLQAESHLLALMMSVNEGKLDPKRLEKWWQAIPLQNAYQRLQAERVLSVLEASELVVSAQMWQDLYRASEKHYAHAKFDLSGLWLRVLGSALEKRQVGRVLMLLTDASLYEDLSRFSPQTQANIMTALRFLGLETLANQAAFEMMIDVPEDASEYY